MEPDKAIDHTEMPTVLADVQSHAVATFVASVIQSSLEIIKEEQDLLDFLDEALEQLAGGNEVHENEATEGNLFPTNMTTVAPMIIPICQLNGETMPDSDEEIPITPITKAEDVPKDTAHKDTSDVPAVPDLAFIHQDGSRQDLGDYIQDIIRGAQEKASEPEMAPLATAENSMQEDVTLTQSYYTDDSPSKESHNIIQSVEVKDGDKEKTTLSGLVPEAPAIQDTIVNNNHEKTPLNDDVDEIIELSDESFGQQSFIEVNSKDRGHSNRKSKGRLGRMKESIMNLLSCASARSTAVS